MRDLDLPSGQDPGFEAATGTIAEGAQEERSVWSAEPKPVRRQDRPAFALRAPARHPSRGLPSRSSRFGVSSRERRMVDQTGAE